MKRLLCMLAIFISFGSTLTKFNQQEFDSYASKYGNKTANLNELEKIVTELNKKATGYTYAVPAFLGISNKDVWQFLETPNNAAENIKKQWQLFVKEQPQTETTIAEAAKKA